MYKQNYHQKEQVSIYHHHFPEVKTKWHMKFNQNLKLCGFTCYIYKTCCQPKVHFFKILFKGNLPKIQGSSRLLLVLRLSVHYWYLEEDKVSWHNFATPTSLHRPKSFVIVLQSCVVAIFGAQMLLITGPWHAPVVFTTSRPTLGAIALFRIMWSILEQPECNKERGKIGNICLYLANQIACWKKVGCNW